MVATVRENSRMALRFPAVVIGKMKGHQWDGKYRTGGRACGEAEFHVAPWCLR